MLMTNRNDETFTPEETKQRLEAALRGARVAGPQQKKSVIPKRRRERKKKKPSVTKRS